MLIQKSYQYELIPNGEQVRKLKQFCGCCRFVFNRGLEEVKKYYESTGHFLNYAQLTAFLPKWKQDADWLKDCNAQVLQQSMKNLSQALINFSAGRRIFHVSKPKAGKTVVDSRRALSQTRITTVSICRKSVGCATVTVEPSSVQSRT